MRARARVVVERDCDGRSVVRELRSQPPLSLLPQRGAVAAGSDAVTVHMVGSATAPLGGDDVVLEIVVGPGASAVLTGVAATLALPGRSRSRLAVRLDVGAGGSLQYLPEPTIVTRRAAHDGELDARLAPGARLRCREVLVAGRAGEACGSYRGHLRVADDGGPLLVQDLELAIPPCTRRRRTWPGTACSPPRCWCGARTLRTPSRARGGHWSHWPGTARWPPPSGPTPSARSATSPGR